MAFNLLLKTQLERFINNLKPQIHTYASSSTARDDVDKVASLNGFILGSGAKVSVKFTDTTTTTTDPSSGNITLNVNSTGAKTIIASETNEICTYEDASEFCDNKVHEFVYDGTNWIWVTNTIKDADALITTSEFEDFTSTSGMPITSMADTYIVDNSQLSSMFTSLSEIGNTVSSTSIAQSELDSTQDSILSSLSTASSELSSEMVVFGSELDDKQDTLLNPLTQADVKDNLSSTDTNKPLSAKQGKILRENISTKVEDGATSSTTRTAGEYITRNGVMYKVASNLASGTTITEGTNVVKKTVGEELTQINDDLTNKLLKVFIDEQQFSGGNNANQTVNISLPQGGTKMCACVPIFLINMSGGWYFNSRIVNYTQTNTTAQFTIYTFDGATYTYDLKYAVIYI